MEIKDQYMRFNMKQFCEERGIPDTHPFLYWLKHIKSQFGLYPRPEGPWVCGGSVLTLVSPRIREHLLEIRRKAVARSVGFLGDRTGLYFYDLDFFCRSRGQYKRFLYHALYAKLGKDWLNESRMMNEKLFRSNNVSFLGTRNKQRGGIFGAAVIKDGDNLYNFLLKRHKDKRSAFLKQENFNYLKSTSVINDGAVNAQMIGFNLQPTIEEVLDSFDIDVCRVGYDGEDLILYSPAMYSIVQDRADPCKDIEKLAGREALKLMSRLKKYRGKGFKVDQSKIDRLQEIVAEQSDTIDEVTAYGELF